MKKKIVRFGILGLGRVVNKRIANVFINELNNAKVTGVFDKDSVKNLFYTKKFKCEFNNNLETFLNQNYDYIYIATESGNHYKHIKACFKKRHNVIVEKPPVLKTSQLIELNKIANIKKLKFYSVFQNRLNNSVQFLKKHLKKNKTKIIYSTLNLSWSRDQAYYSDWHGKWKLDGGVAAQQGIHYIDILCYLFGQPIKSVSFISNKSNRLEAEDTHAAIILFKNNITCTCNFTTALKPKDYEASIQVIAENEIFSLQGLCCNKITYTNLKNTNSKKIHKLCLNNSENVKTGYGNSHSKVIQKIINYQLKKSTKKPLKAIDSLPSIKLLNMMYSSHEHKTWVLYKNKNIKSRLGN